MIRDEISAAFRDGFEHIRRAFVQLDDEPLDMHSVGPHDARDIERPFAERYLWVGRVGRAIFDVQQWRPFAELFEQIDGADAAGFHPIRIDFEEDII